MPENNRQPKLKSKEEEEKKSGRHQFLGAKCSKRPFEAVWTLTMNYFEMYKGTAFFRFCFFEISYFFTGMLLLELYLEWNNADFRFVELESDLGDVVCNVSIYSATNRQHGCMERYVWKNFVFILRPLQALIIRIWKYSYTLSLTYTRANFVRCISLPLFDN